MDQHFKQPQYAPLYRQVKDDLCEKIKSDVFPSKSFLPTERELTSIYKVSRGTVRQALNELESDGFVASHQGKGTVVLGSNPAPVGKPRVKSMNIGFLFGWERDIVMSAPYYSVIYTAAEREALAHDYKVLFISSSIVRHKPPIAWFKQNFDGLLISEITDDALIKSFTHEKIPFVLVNCATKEGARTNSVVIDNAASSLDAVQYLIRLGHKHIGFISESINGFDHPVYKERFKGYQLALARNSIAYNEDLVVREKISPKGIFRHESPALIKMLRSSRPRPTAIFACNDVIAMESMLAMQSIGLRVPQDINVVGFDDIEAGKGAKPALTTMRVDTERMGITAVRRLLPLIRAKKPFASKETVIPVQLVARESTCILNKGDASCVTRGV